MDSVVEGTVFQAQSIESPPLKDGGGTPVAGQDSTSPTEVSIPIDPMYAVQSDADDLEAELLKNMRKAVEGYMKGDVKEQVIMDKQQHTANETYDMLLTLERDNRYARMVEQLGGEEHIEKAIWFSTWSRLFRLYVKQNFDPARGVDEKGNPIPFVCVNTEGEHVLETDGDPPNGVYKCEFANKEEESTSKYASHFLAAVRGMALHPHETKDTRVKELTRNRTTIHLILERTPVLLRDIRIFRAKYGSRTQYDGEDCKDNLKQINSLKENIQSNITILLEKANDESKRTDLQNLKHALIHGVVVDETNQTLVINETPTETSGMPPDYSCTFSEIQRVLDTLNQKFQTGVDSVYTDEIDEQMKLVPWRTKDDEPTFLELSTGQFIKQIEYVCRLNDSTNFVDYGSPAAVPLPWDSSDRALLVKRDDPDNTPLVSIKSILDQLFQQLQRIRNDADKNIDDLKETLKARVAELAAKDVERQAGIKKFREETSRVATDRGKIYQEKTKELDSIVKEFVQMESLMLIYKTRATINAAVLGSLVSLQSFAMALKAKSGHDLSVAEVMNKIGAIQRLEAHHRGDESTVSKSLIKAEAARTHDSAKQATIAVQKAQDILKDQSQKPSKDVMDRATTSYSLEPTGLKGAAKVVSNLVRGLTPTGVPRVRTTGLGATDPTQTASGASTEARATSYDGPTGTPDPPKRPANNSTSTMNPPTGRVQTSPAGGNPIGQNMGRPAGTSTSTTGLQIM